MLPSARTSALGACTVAVLLAGCSADGGSRVGEPSSAVPLPTGSSVAGPRLDVAVVADGLDHVWDVVQAPDGTLLVDERGGGFTAVLPDGSAREVAADLDDLFADGETGLMGMALDPAFGENRRLYSCQGDTGGSIQVVAWSVAPDWSALTRVDDPLVGGLPLNERSGRHGGCRLEFAPDGALLVGTGDTARGPVAQDPGSLGGKVLRVEPVTGDVAVWTLGHRNVQGLAVRPGSEQVFAVEHGPDRDDEVNLLAEGGNYGWDPDGGGSYDESVPMTDPAIPGAVPAVWSSGSPTLATSGATFLDGEQWGSYDGLLLVALLKAQGVLALRLDDDGAVVEQFRLPELDGAHGRIRTVQQGVDGALYVTTDNGGGRDALLRVTASG
ncbi:sorbosone dehydrogenase family protein [Blastococcus sp. TF02A-30]|uniref:PQQ-dependent sugar dehydrogenase n=1 Tax=Blastococcus sp. TF02A-30 TaxID=2250580 RepID=UPI000DEABE74|nr:PQQ-dependent sugar dehydrogenase [Blastococcus sp. TF02A-30]RBY93085.1 PQQ-dependent sugar dehydrogenase [Blastococcus sp. TF02A-30]